MSEYLCVRVCVSSKHTVMWSLEETKFPESLKNEIIQIKARGNYQMLTGYSPVQVQESSLPDRDLNRVIVVELLNNL